MSRRTFRMRIRNKKLTRKERKIERNTKRVPIKLDAEDESYARAMGRALTRMERDKSKDGKLFYDNGRGCYDYTGGRQMCSTCPYNKAGNGCHKTRAADDEVLSLSQMRRSYQREL